MNEKAESSDQNASQARFEELSKLVSVEFEVEEALIENDVPTYYLHEPQETKQPFLRLLKRLETIKRLLQQNI